MLQGGCDKFRSEKHQMLLKLILLLFAALPAYGYGQTVLTGDSTEARTMRSTIYIRPSRRGYSVYIDGRPASDSVLADAFANYPAAAKVYAKFDKMMSQGDKVAKRDLIGLAATIAFLPFFAIPAVSKSDLCAGLEIGLIAGSFCYFVGWGFISKAKLSHAVRLYDRWLLTRDGLQTRRMHRRIKLYNERQIGVRGAASGG
jgi:hypothetical protein